MKAERGGGPGKYILWAGSAAVSAAYQTLSEQSCSQTNPAQSDSNSSLNHSRVKWKKHTLHKQTNKQTPRLLLKPRLRWEEENTAEDGQRPQNMGTLWIWDCPLLSHITPVFIVMSLDCCCRKNTINNFGCEITDKCLDSVQVEQQWCSTTLCKCSGYKRCRMLNKYCTFQETLVKVAMSDRVQDKIRIPTI